MVLVVARGGREESAIAAFSRKHATIIAVTGITVTLLIGAGSCLDWNRITMPGDNREEQD